MATTSTTTLDSAYTSLIRYQIQSESKPLTRLQTKADSLDVQRAIYIDLKAKIDALKTTTKALISSDPFYSFTEGRTVTVTPSDSEKTVLSAAVSSTAVAGSYQIEDIVIAKNDKVRSDAQEYADQALSLTGSFVIGGALSRSATKVNGTTNTINDFNTSEIAEGQQEFGTGKYYVETRKNTDGTWQFRVVNDEGTALKIKSSGTTYSNNWQTIPTSGEAYDTGRGLTINFGTDVNNFIAATKSTGAASVNYVAKGNQVEVTSDMSLIDIADAINSGTYGDGNGVTASVLNKQLVISASNTGSAHRLTMSETSGSVLTQLGVLSSGTYKNVMQTARDASFTVEGLSITRSSNTGLTDVIAGVTLNLAADAEGQSATINIATDNSAAKTMVKSFISNFNSLQTYLTAKTTNTKNEDGTYKRAALSGDQTILSLRYSLLSLFSKYDSTGGLYKSMSAIGLEIADGKSISIKDEGKLTTALNNNYSEVVDLIDRVMSNIETKVENFTGKSAYLDKMITATDMQKESINDQIETWNTRLTKREEYLTKQYTEVQAQMTLLSYQSSTNSSWINTLTSLFS